MLTFNGWWRQGRWTSGIFTNKYSFYSNQLECRLSRTISFIDQPAGCLWSSQGKKLSIRTKTYTLKDIEKLNSTRIQSGYKPNFLTQNGFEQAMRYVVEVPSYKDYRFQTFGLWINSVFDQYFIHSWAKVLYFFALEAISVEIRNNFFTDLFVIISSRKQIGDKLSSYCTLILMWKLVVIFGWKAQKFS